MKLKDTFISQEFDGEHILVATGGSGFSGLVRSNATAAFIIECLKKETTKEEIVDKMCTKYDATHDVIAESVDGIIEKLRSIDALDE